MNHIGAFLEDGDTFVWKDGTYATEVCDFCGRKVKCDFFENTCLGYDHVCGYDCCRKCQQERVIL